MSSLYRNALPQLDGGFFLSDGGIETSLIFNDGLELPHFAAFHLFSRPGGDAALRNYFHATHASPSASAPASSSRAPPGARAWTGPDSAIRRRDLGSCQSTRDSSSG